MNVVTAVLSGKELFNYNSSLFVDDDGAIDESEEQAMNADMIKRKQQEDQRIREEEERIQAEQQRLMELQQIELEVRRQKEADRRLAAAAPNHTTFVLAGVTINQVVFEDDEQEDLAPFSEETLFEAEAAEQRAYATEALSEEMAEAYMQGSDDEEGEDGAEGQDEGDSEDDGDSDDDKSQDGGEKGPQNGERGNS